MPFKHLRFPRDQSFSASAPCRIDSGGTWDIKALALPYEPLGPTTVNIAINMRTTVTLSPFDPGWIKISSKGFRNKQILSTEDLAPRGSFKSYIAAIKYFGMDGMEVHIDSRAPVKSALGGSSTALVATLKALSKALVYLHQPPLSRHQILMLAYHLEDAMSGGGCGLQDQAAATFGGANQWLWRHSRPGSPFVRRALLKKEGLENLSNRLLVAFSGKTHSSARINKKWINDFLSGKTLAGWIKVNQTVHKFADALTAQDWNECARCLREEMTIRKEITPEAILPITSTLIQMAEQAGCGARFSGAGAGGAVWAIGEASRIKRLKDAWGRTLAQVPRAHLLECKADHQGVT